jgi:hypothetical protein
MTTRPALTRILIATGAIAVALGFISAPRVPTLSLTIHTPTLHMAVSL